MEQVNLKTEKIEEILDVLEKKLPKREFNLYIPSSDFNPKDIISIQKEANKMMKHIGLDDYIATITYEKTKDGTAGYINLNYDKEVWITVDKGSNHLKWKMLAIMAHEICHKYLYINGVHFPKPFDNLLEWYTDLATIYVGFAILTLNGCKIQSESRYHERIIAITHLTGYLEKSNFEYAYLRLMTSQKKSVIRYNRYLSDKIGYKRIICYNVSKLLKRNPIKHKK